MNNQRLKCYSRARHFSFTAVWLINRFSSQHFLFITPCRKWFFCVAFIDWMMNSYLNNPHKPFYCVDIIIIHDCVWCSSLLHYKHSTLLSDHEYQFRDEKNYFLRSCNRYHSRLVNKIMSCNAHCGRFCHTVEYHWFYFPLENESESATWEKVSEIF